MDSHPLPGKGGPLPIPEARGHPAWACRRRGTSSLSLPHLDTRDRSIQESKPSVRKNHGLETTWRSFPSIIRASVPEAAWGRKEPELQSWRSGFHRFRIKYHVRTCLCTVRMPPPESWLLFDSWYCKVIGGISWFDSGKWRLREGHPEGHRFPRPSQSCGADLLARLPPMPIICCMLVVVAHISQVTSVATQLRNSC